MSYPDPTYDVLCYGTINVDNVTHVPHLPSPRRDTAATMEYSTLGGEALTVAMPLATWGLRVLLVGNLIGTDASGQFIVDELVKYPNIDTRYLQQHPNVPTPYSRILVTPDDQHSRINYWYDDLPKVELTAEHMSQARLLSVDSYAGHEGDRAAMVARELGRPVISADAIWPQYPLARLSDVVVISRAQLQGNFPGVYEYDHVLELQAQGAGVIMVTDGPRPVLVVRADGSAFGVEPFDVPDVVDTTGAGNLFKAAIIYAWIKTDWELEQKVRFACAAAGLSCRRQGGVARPASLDEILALMGHDPR